MTDLYPDEEGYIDEETVIGNCKAATAITLHGAVALGLTGVSSYLSVIAAGVRTGVGIALKAADTNDYIPVAFKGFVKQTVGAATFSVGQLVCSSGTTAGVVEKMPNLVSLTTLSVFVNLLGEWNGLANGGTTLYYRLGMAFQPGTTAGDEALIAIGRLC